MRAGSRLLALAIPFACVAGCSLFTSLDGLTGGDDGGVDGSIGDASSDGGTLRDAEVDSPMGDAGSWAFVSNNAVTTGTPSTPLTVTSNGNVEAGDLVIVGCDSGNAAGFITLSGFSSDLLTLNVIGPRSDGEAYEAQIGWGIAQGPIGSLSVTASVENPAETSFLDCSLNIYRGGGPDASLVAEGKTNGPDNSGNATCGPIQTAPGGLAYYIAARSNCVGPPYDPAFTQRTGINGNPNGDVVPTDGGIVQSEMMPCSGSVSSWICYMMTLTP
jgi:hypothetical protein